MGRIFSLTFKPGDSRGMVVAIVSFVILLFVDLFAVPIHYEQWQTSNWDRVQGTVDDIYVWEDCSGDDGCTYGLKVVYSYEIKGQLFRSDQISLVDWEGSTDSNREWRDDFEREHPRFSTIDVFVDPEDKDRSVLITGFSVGSGAITNIVILSCCNFLLLFLGLGSAGNADSRVGTKLEKIGFGFPQSDLSKEPMDDLRQPSLREGGPKDDETQEEYISRCQEAGYSREQCMKGHEGHEFLSYSESQVGEDSESAEEASEEVGWWEAEDGAERGI